MVRAACLSVALLAGSAASAEEDLDQLLAISRGLDTAVAMATALLMQPIGPSCDASADDLARIGYSSRPLVSNKAKSMLIELSRGMAEACWRYPTRLEKYGLLYLVREILAAPAEGGTIIERLDRDLGTTWGVTRNRL